MWNQQGVTMSLSLRDKVYLNVQGNSQPFNKDFIYLRDKDDPEFYLSSMCRVLEILDGIKFLGCEIITDEKEIWQRHIKPASLEIGESRYSLAIMKFHVEHGDTNSVGGKSSADIEMKLLIPKLVDDFFFRIRGVTYGALYQIADKGFYVTARNCVIKTLSMPIMASYNNTTTVAATTINKSGVRVDGNMRQTFINIRIFKKEINPFLFIFSKYGLDKGLEIAEINDIVSLVNVKDFVEEEYLSPNALIIKLLGDYVIIVDKVKLMSERNKARTVFSFIHLMKSLRKTLFSVYKIETWRMLLGKHFTTNEKALEKAASTVKSFERTMDDITKASLSFVPLEYKENSFTLLVWLMNNLDTLKKNDNHSLFNKRLRFYEYIFYSLQAKFNTATNRNLSNGRSNTFNSKKRIFNVQLNHIIKQLLTTNLHRYDNCVSGLDLFSSGLKWSSRGPQAMQDDDVPLEFRDIHPSQLGIIDIYNKSQSDPGMQGIFTPFIRNSLTGMVFSNELQLQEDDVDNDILG